MFHVVIPARYGSTRLPGKALADLNGRPMTWHVWSRAMASGAQRVVVATDDMRIADALRPEGVEVVMTRGDHSSGTDRLAEVVTICRWSDAQVIVNLQGDEPLMPAENLDQVASLLAEHPEAAMATLSEPLVSPVDFTDSAVVKVVADDRGRAMYFSRAGIPFVRDSVAGEVPINAQRHIGLYAYRAGFLREFAAMSPSRLEQIESLEQLRALERGAIIQIAEAKAPVPPGIDTPEDLKRIRALMAT